MGHMSYNLTQRRRYVIRPTLNREYATYCASHVPVPTLLFGDELQTQLNHIPASNKIKNVASGAQFPPSPVLQLVGEIPYSRGFSGL